MTPPRSNLGRRKGALKAAMSLVLQKHLRFTLARDSCNLKKTSEGHHNYEKIQETACVDSPVGRIEQRPQKGEREQISEHEHRRGEGEEPRVVAEELVELRSRG